MHCRIARALVAGLALAGIPTLANAQLVRGRVSEESSGTPVVGAVVALLDATGTRVALGLTAEDGRFALRAPVGSAVTLEVKRIGLARAHRPIEPLAAGETRDVEVAVAPIPAIQPRVQVSARSSCGRAPGGSQQVGALWEDLTAALTATELTARQRLMSVRIARYVRRLDVGGRRVLDEQREEKEGVWEQPFRSAPPAVLSKTGYVVKLPSDTLVYHAPDVTVLLSDEFVSEHCFRVVAGDGDDRALVGIAFEPTRARQLPDVRGVLWLDAATRQLRRVDFRYTELPVDDVKRFGGRVEFERMPQGSWIVSRWWIRMPVVGRPPRPGALLPGESRSSTAPVLIAMQEEGGEVLSARRLGRPNQ
jgi:hypothetical protein